MTEREKIHFADALREVDRAWSGARPSPALDLRVAASLHKRNVILPFALAGAAALAAMLFFTLNSQPQKLPVAEVRFEPARCEPAIARAQLHLDRACVVSLPDLEIRALDPSDLIRTTAGVRVVRGAASFNVAAPATVLVSGGRIEVIGTRFIVREEDGGGSVELIEGRIRFIANNGAKTEMLPGQTVRWSTQKPAPIPPRVEVEQPPPAPVKTEEKAAPRPAPVEAAIETPPIPRDQLFDNSPPKTWSAAKTAAAVEWVSQLRAEGRYAEAVVWIAQLLEAPLDDRAAEVLSFERGELLERKLDDKPKACRHWRAHRDRFAAGRYRTEVALALQRCEGGNFPAPRE